MRDCLLWSVNMYQSRIVSVNWFMRGAIWSLLPKRNYYKRRESSVIHFFFIAGGFCASYYSTVTKECILGFFEEGQFCTSWYSFQSKRKSFMAIKAVVDTAAVVISYEHYDFILRECPEFAYVICRVLSNIIQVGEERSYVLRSRSARGRVQYYKDNHDIYYLMKHVPQYSIASFLNMTPETFSKIISERDKDRKWFFVYLCDII